LALAASQGPTLPQSGPASFDVAGVKLGMTTDAVRRALAAAGYAVERTDHGMPFGDNVAVAAAQAQGLSAINIGKDSSVSQIVGRGPHAEHIEIGFDQWPAGAFVSSVSLSVMPERQTVADFQAQIEGKYGKPSLKTDALSFQWCTPGEKGCDRMSLPQLPTLRVGYSTPYSIFLNENGEVASQLKAVFKAAVEARAPKIKRSAF